MVGSTAMKKHHSVGMKIAALTAFTLGFIAFAPFLHADQLEPATVAGYDHYIQVSEQRMATELKSGPFLHIDGLSAGDRNAALAELKEGHVVSDAMETLDQGHKIDAPGGLIHHWIGTVFIPGVTLEQTVKFLQDYDNRAKYYAPSVERSKLLEHNGDHFKMYMRLRDKKIITVVLDTDYDIVYSYPAADRAVARSTTPRIQQVENDGQKDETLKPMGDDGGYMWRLNTYWNMLQRDGGVYVQLEAISLSRDIPTGLAWMIAPIINKFPRESLEFTLGRTRDAVMGWKK
jgi:hypothetical protein